MIKGKLKKTLIITGISLSVLLVVLVIHIVMVTQQHKPNSSTIAMARIHISPAMDSCDAKTIVSYLYQQPGVSHVLCNTSSKIVVFTYYPTQVNANQLVSNLNKTMPYQAVRYIPTDAEMKAGCPVAVQGFSSKLYKAIKQVF